MLNTITNVGIQVIASCIPTNQIDIAEYAPELITSVKDAKRFTKSTGFAKLAISNKGTTTADLCYAAVQKIFTETNYKPQDIDGLIFVTQTSNWELPATSHFLQYKLGLSDNTICFDINEGCSGYEQGLYLATTLIFAGQCKNVLLLAGDTISKLTDPADRATRLIFGDAGTASIISRDKENMTFNINSYGDRYKAIMSGKLHSDGVMCNGGGTLASGRYGYYEFYS